MGGEKATESQNVIHTSTEASYLEEFHSPKAAEGPFACGDLMASFSVCHSGSGETEKFEKVPS